MKRIVLAIGLLSLIGACGNGSDIKETQQELTCRGLPAIHDSVVIGDEYASWYNDAGFVGNWSSIPSIIRWGAGVVTRDYTDSVGNFATHCVLPYETFFVNTTQPVVPGGTTGCFNAIRNTGGTCQWNNTQTVQPRHYFIYPLSAGGYMEFGYEFRKVNQTGQVYRIDLNFPGLEGGHFN